MPRRATERDLDLLAALHAQLARHHAGDGPRFALRSDPEDSMRDWLAPRLRDPLHAVWLTEGSGAPAGPLGFVVAGRRSRPDFYVETERLEIDWIFVRPDQRRAGLGRQLVEAASAALDPEARLRLEIQVSRANADGRAFWRAMGYEPVVDVLERRR